MNNEALGDESSGFRLERAFCHLRQEFSGQRWVRVALEALYDSMSWVCGLLTAISLTGDMGEARPATFTMAGLILAVIPLSLGSGLLAGLYRGRYQRGSFDEVMGSTMATCVMVLFLAPLSPMLVGGQRAILPTLAGSALLALSAMLGARYVVFAVRQRSRTPAAATVNIIVFGAGEAGSMLIRRLHREPNAAYRPVAVLDDDPAKRRLRIHGIQVLGDRTQMAEVATRTGATVLVIAIARASGTAISELTGQAESYGLTPKVVPSVTELLTGSGLIEGVRDPRISDLLGRRPVQTDITSIAKHFAGKRILVTGAGGSIGSELCAQLYRFSPGLLLMMDRDESALHAAQLSLHGRALLDSDETILADIRDPQRMMDVFGEFHPQIVFHAAALKHLPLLERYPAEAVKSNIYGTLHVLEAAAACGAESFVNISTDKAADPVSVLGYSKRIAERLTAQVASEATGNYISVRFGNVLGSRGSVLTALSAQVDAGGPVTVTHPEVTRYFMTANEAVQLVLQAAVIGADGEALVLDMGDPVRIADIARRLAAGSPRPVDIVFTGLRAGEKLQEDLLGQGEADSRPHHPLIRQTPVAPLRPERLSRLDLAADPGSLRRALAACTKDSASPLPRESVRG